MTFFRPINLRKANNCPPSNIITSSGIKQLATSAQYVSHCYFLFQWLQNIHCTSAITLLHLLRKWKSEVHNGTDLNLFLQLFIQTRFPSKNRTITGKLRIKLPWSFITRVAVYFRKAYIKELFIKLFQLNGICHSLLSITEALIQII